MKTRARANKKRRTPRKEARLPGRKTRCFAIGDPQSTFENFSRILAHHGLLGGDRRLRPGVSLLSIGDHFDFSSDRSPRAGGREGLRILRWLASHPPEQAIILAGNHDMARVTELAWVTDEMFEAARTRALEIHALAEGSLERASQERSFTEAFPDLPTSEAARRDYQTFSEEQRATVQELLLAGRMRLAQAGWKHGRPIVLTHAGVTRRELELLGLPLDVAAQKIAHHLNLELDRAVSRVRPEWSAGRTAALDLAPLSRGGRAGREGGGLLYHRPSGSPDRTNPAPLARRRFHPTELPPALLQACGHTIHKTCVKGPNLGAWTEPSALREDFFKIRALRVNGDRIAYQAAQGTPDPGEAVLYMIDGAMHKVDRPSQYPLLELDAWAAPQS